MNIDMIGAVMQETVQAGGSSNAFQPSPTAADFAAMIKKLAGPSTLWEEQTPERIQQSAEGDDTDARGMLASAAVKRNRL